MTKFTASRAPARRSCGLKALIEEEVMAELGLNEWDGDNKKLTRRSPTA
jgi:hypothetical protein